MLIWFDDEDVDEVEGRFFVGNVLCSTLGDVGGADEDDEEADDDDPEDSDDECVEEVADETFFAVSAALFLTMRLIDDTEGKLSPSQIPSDCN